MTTTSNSNNKQQQQQQKVHKLDIKFQSALRTGRAR
jgi:hypothetical protein